MVVFKTIRFLFLLVFFIGLLLFVGLSHIDPNDYKETLEQAVFNQTGHKLSIKGNVGWKIFSTTPGVLLEDVQIPTRSGFKAKNLLEVKAAVVALSLRDLLDGNIVINQIYLSAPKITLQENASGELSWVAKKPVRKSEEKTAQKKDEKKDNEDSATKKRRLHFDIKKVKIENGAFEFIEPEGSYKVTISEWSLNKNGGDHPISVYWKGAYNNKLAYEININMDEVDELLEQTKPFPVDVSLKFAGRDEIKIEGEIENLRKLDGVNVKFNANFPTIKRQMAKLGWSIFDDLPATAFSGSLTLKNKLYTLKDFNFESGTTNFKLSGSWDAKRKVPQVKADLNIGRLNLVELFDFDDGEPGFDPGPNKEKEPDPNNDPDKVFEDVPLGVEYINAYNVSLKLKVGQLDIWRKMVVNDIAINASLQNGKLTIKNATAQYMGGIIHANIKGDASSGKVLKADVEVSGAKISVAEILDSLSIHIFEGGDSYVKVNATGEGADLASLMASLNGKVIGQALPAKGLGIASFFVGKDIFSSIFSSSSKNVKINCASANVDIKDGIATSEGGLVVETADVNFIGTGNTNFKDETLEISILPVAKKGVGLGTGGAINMFQYKGVIAHPDLILKPTSLLGGATTTFLTIITGGTYFIGRHLFNRITNDPSPCKTALDGRFIIEELDAELGAQIKKQERQARRNRSVFKKITDGLSQGASEIGRGISAAVPLL